MTSLSDVMSVAAAVRVAVLLATSPDVVYLDQLSAIAVDLHPLFVLTVETARELVVVCACKESLAPQALAHLHKNNQELLN
jgi:hypothetical protein